MKGKIMIVEDYADWRDLLHGLVQREGYEVHAVSTPEEAREYIENNKNLDLVILDIRLVEIDENNEDGMLLLEEIHNELPHTRTIMITGHGTMELQRRAFKELRAFDFFKKEEFNSDEFRNSLKQGVELAAMSRQKTKGQDYRQHRKFEAWQKKNK